MADEFNSSTDSVLEQMKYLFLLVQLNKSLAVGELKIITLGSDVQVWIFKSRLTESPGLTDSLGPPGFS